MRVYRIYALSWDGIGVYETDSPGLAREIASGLQGSDTIVWGEIVISP